MSDQCCWFCGSHRPPVLSSVWVGLGFFGVPTMSTTEECPDCHSTLTHERSV